MISNLFGRRVLKANAHTDSQIFNPLIPDIETLGMGGSTDKRTHRDSQGSIRFGGKRCTFAILAFCAISITYMNWVDLSVAIVAMVRRGEGKLNVLGPQKWHV